MNVAFDPWIPVVTLSGEPAMSSLTEIFTDGAEYADLAVRPHERVALMRLFICVAHAALEGPKDYDDWCAVEDKLPEAARTYLEDWKDSFALFHPTKPWLQVASITKGGKGKDDPLGEWTPVTKLNFSFASGNNSTLFDHDGTNQERTIALAHTVLSMLAYQCFSTGGLIAQVFWQGRQTTKSSKDAPCVPASMVHAMLRGPTVLRSICLNLPTYEDVRMHYGVDAIGRPLWEHMPRSFSDTEAARNATATYLGRLVPMTRLIRLHNSGGRMLLGDGLAFPSFADGFPAEPTATVVVRNIGKKEVQALLSFNPSKAFWRQLSAMVVKRQAGQPGGPLALNALQEGEPCDLVVSALARDQATIVETAESVFHVPGTLARPEGAQLYEEEVRVAEAIASRLGWAVESYRAEIDGGWEGRLKGAGPNKGELRFKLQAVATSHYWTHVENSLALLMDHMEAIGTERAMPTRDLWRRMLAATARDAYRAACGQETPRQVRAFVKGWNILNTFRNNNAKKLHATGEVEV